MIAVPPSKPDKWHKRVEWVKYANTLFRYYSRRSNYALRLQPGKGYVAAVDPKTRIVHLNPDFATAPADLARAVRHAPTRMRDAIIQNIKGYLAHEAAHVRFSAAKPQGLLGQVWNSIEDERIERLMSQAHPDLAAAFTYLGDTHLTRAWPTLQFSPLEGVLTWRWAHDHPTLRWECNDPDTWQRVRPHVEAAWAESDPEKVEEHARAILEELRLPENARTPEIMNSPLVTCPDLPRRRSENAKGAGSDGDGQREAGRQTSGADDDENRDQRQDDAQNAPGAGGGEGQRDDQGDARDRPGDDQRPDANDQDASGGEDQESGTVDAPRTETDEDADQSDSSQGRAADHDHHENESEESEGDLDDDPFGTPSGGGAAGGEGVSYTGDEPEAPAVLPEDPDHAYAREVLSDVEGHARDLAAALALPDTPSLRVSHESRGRFDYARHATGAQRQFRYRKHPRRKEMPRITLLHDNSGSMGRHTPNAAQWHAVRATMMLQRACELSRTPLNVIAFNSSHAFVATHADDPEAARGAISGIRSMGGTALAPALHTALATTHPSRKRHVIVIYCDGQINPGDAEHCLRLTKEHPDTFILPILIGPKTQTTQFKRAFGRALQVKNADELAPKLKTWIAANLHI